MTAVLIKEIWSDGNVRFDDNDVADLASSIDRQGLLQPINIAERENGEGGRYLLIAGHRRLAAVIANGDDMINVVFNATVDTEADRLSMQYAENVQRKDLSAAERAQVALDLKDQHLNQGDIATELGVSKKKVGQLQKVARAIPESSRLLAAQLNEPALFEVVDQADGIPEVVGEALHGIVDSRDSVWRAVHQAKSSYAYEQFVQLAESYLDDLRKDNIDIVELGDWQDDWNPIHVWPTENPGTARAGRGFIQVPVKKHRLESCHRASIYQTFDKYEIIEWCADPMRHAKKGKSELTDDTITKRSNSAGISEEEKASRKAKLERKDQAAEWLEGVSIKDKALEPLIEEAIDTWASAYMGQTLVQSMGLERVMVDGYGDKPTYSAKETILAHVRDKFQSPVSRLTYLALLLHAEQFVSSTYGPARVLGEARSKT